MVTALDGMRVLDFTHHIAGPYCTKILADYGADVVKIERPLYGDPTRHSPPFFHDRSTDESSGLFLHLNTNKQSVAVDLKSADGYKIVLGLVRQVDVVVENFAPRVMPSLGFDYETLHKANPNLVMASISNFGQTGPYRDYKMSELTMYALSGIMSSSGLAIREPVKLALTVQQIYAGMVSSTAVIGAYLGARLNDTRQHLDISLFEIMVNHQDRGLMAHAAYQYTGAVPQRTGSGGRVQVTPTGVYPCADGYVQMFALNQVWRNACTLIERPDLIDDPHFTAPENFSDNAAVRSEFEALLLKWLSSKTKQEVMERAQSVGYICGAINSIGETFDDRQLTSRKFFVEVEHPYTGPLRYPGAPFKMTRTPWQAGRAPTLGEHTETILRERLEFSHDDVERLREQGVI